MKAYKNRVCIDMGGGSGVLVTNFCGVYNANHSRDFSFVHCNYANFKGTELSWADNVSVLVSNDYIDSDKLKQYTDKQCLELIMEHISATAMFECIDRAKNRAAKEAVADFQSSVLKLFGVYNV
jgi:hypothetical protein